MAKLYLIRHGETDYNNAMRFQGRTDILLNQKGIEQAEKAAEFFRDIPLQAIYTSSLKRARTTAEIIGKVKGLEPQATDALQEMSFGIWENMNSKDIQKKYAKEWKDFFASPATTTIPQGECACRECVHNLFLLLGPVLHAGLCKPDAILTGMASNQSIVLI